MEIADLQQEYLADVDSMVETMREHARALAKPGRFKNAFPTLLFYTHQLKGSGGSMGFPRISDVAGAMGAELGQFLIDRPTPEELSGKVMILIDDLAREVHSAACPASSSSSALPSAISATSRRGPSKRSDRPH